MPATGMQRRSTGRGFATASPTTTTEPSLSQKAASKAVDLLTQRRINNRDEGELKEIVADSPSYEFGRQIGNAKFDEFEQAYAQGNIMQVVRLIGGAMIGIAVLVVVLNQVFQLDSISNGSGPFSGITDSLESTGVAAISLLVVGLLVVSANRVMGFFGGGGL